MTAIPPTRQPETRVNERIRVPQVRVVGEDGEQIGVLPTREALELAKSRGLDLVEVAANVRPPVCRILDYGKYKYEQNRRARQAKKKQHQTQIKEVKMRPKIEEHDYRFKVEHAKEFLADRDKVKLTIMFRGREMARQELGHRLIQKVIEELADIAQVESHPRSEGRTLTAVLSPKAQKGAPPKPSKPKSDDAKASPTKRTTTERKTAGTASAKGGAADAATKE